MAGGDHVGVDVADRDLAAAALQKAKGDIAGAAGDIQQMLIRPRGQPIEGGVLPQPVDPAAHQVVHQVIAAGDRGEHLAHQAGLVGAGDIAETKMGAVGHEFLPAAPLGAPLIG